MSPLTSENYFSPEMNMAYMGHSQYLAFERCEAAALAELKGEYVRPASTALMVGSYVDAYFSGEMEEFTAQHPEMFKRDGTLKSEFLQANKIIERMEGDELYMMLMAGRKQVIKTGEIAGVPFKIKIDSLLDAEQSQAIYDKFPEARKAMGFCDGAIVDQKVMRDMEPVWSPEDQQKLPFVEAWGYDVEGAIYQAIEGNMLPFILAVGTKEERPDLGAFLIPDEELEEKLEEVKQNAPRYRDIKLGKIQPRRCEHCPYCKATRRLTGIIDYKEVEV